MRLEDLHGRRVALLGLGEDVRAALGVIVAAQPSELVLVDTGATTGDLIAGAEGAAQLRVVDLDEAATWAEVFVRSPGFPRYLPSLVEARARGARMTTPLDLWMGARRPGQRVVAVTGTKGKSTTTDLIGHFATEAGMRVGMAGNLGIPVFADGWDRLAPVIVLEVSSYQASDLHHVPDIAVLTSLTEDHLDWHGGVEQYHADKLRVLSNEALRAPVVIVSAGSPEAVEATARFDPVVVVSPDAGPALPQQRVQNAALAAEVVRELGGPELSTEQILAGAARSMPGRLDVCPAPVAPGWDGVRFVDDALASNPSATAAGLTWARQQDEPTVLVLGGAERGVASQPLAEEIARWSPGRLRVVTLPSNGDVLAERCGAEVVSQATTLEDAVRSSADALAADAPEGGGSERRGIVMFSPAAPTPQGSGNWQDRSAAFRRAVLELR